jgi:twitching motility two-component system response regulator PilG
LGQETNNNISSIRVMVIDDSPTIRRTAEVYLKRAGFHVFVAADGFAAMAIVKEHQPDIIFVDVVMPRLDGYQTCTLIKKNRSFATTPVIMLSSKDGLFDRARGRIAGSEEYLNKPFTEQDLVNAVSRHLGDPEVESSNREQSQATYVRQSSNT